MARFSAGSLVVLAIALAFAPPAAAQLEHTADPLPGSNFQGGDGDQVPADPWIDWLDLRQANRVQHNPDETGANSSFTGSEELEPGNWDLTTEPADGHNPAKDNILDAWSAVDQSTADTFLYLGFTRQVATGTTFVTFELNRDRRMWDNGNARIPCRTTGDLLISYEPHGNEPVVDVFLRRWRTTNWDEGTGCATEGEVTSVRATRVVVAQAAMNENPIASHLPGTLQGTIDPRLFGEASLNLSELLQGAFGRECFAFESIWMHSRASDSLTSNLEDFVAPQPLAVRTCAASGVKFFDRDAMGDRDDDDPGIPRWLIWADFNDNGRQERNEPFAVTDNDGRYVIYDIRPPQGTYRLRERVLPGVAPVATDWTCSHPTTTAPGGRFPCAHGPIDPDTTPDAVDRDFGNWFPARLTVEKEIFPAGDPGRFDLLVNGAVVRAEAGDGASETVSLDPGQHTVAEAAAAGTDPTGYRTTVTCAKTSEFGPFLRAVSMSVDLRAGEEWTCTFFNVRPDAPAIAIVKRGPRIAQAGDTLRYELLVTNPGLISFPEDAVVVTDDRCDDEPELVSKEGDATPGTLDPDDRWIYRCSHRTVAGADCEPTTVRNTGTVTGTVNRLTVMDDDAISTILLCPDGPRPGPGPGGGGEPGAPGPIAPAGPTPPRAGAVGRARFEFARATRRCLRTRIPRVNLRGTRIARVRIFVNGRLRRGLNVRTLQRRVRPRVTLPPGRYRVTAAVTFERGSGTPPIRLTRIVRICGRRAAPNFTG